MGVARGKAYYDAVFKASRRYNKPYRDTRDFPIFVWVRQRIEGWGAGPVVELGCGTGQFGHYLYDEGLRDYVGIDYSSTAIEIARSFSPQQFIEGDVRTDMKKIINGRGLHREKRMMFVVLEVLEHIDEDLAVLEQIPGGSGVILSVPSFDFDGHVRHFPKAGDVYDRYGALLNFRDGTMMDYHFVFAALRRKNGEKECSKQNDQSS